MVHISRNPEEGLTAQADFAMKQGRIQEAEALFNQALILDPNNPQTLKSIGFMMLNTGRYRQALDFLGRAAELRPDDAKIYNGLGIF